MSYGFSFTTVKKMDGSLGRAGVLSTPHGDVETPAFVPVGTKATVKSITPEMLLESGAQLMLANTYHLFLQPGDDIVRDAGGLGKFMNWPLPTMTDSGGFQVFSLGAAYGKDISKITKVTDPNFLLAERTDEDGMPRLAEIGSDGVSFRSHLDGALHYITPERSIEIQHNLGADIIFAFDECTSPAETLRYQEEALNRTHRWAEKSLKRHQELEEEKKRVPSPNPFPKGRGKDAVENDHERGEHGITLFPLGRGQGDGTLPPQALFGIVQGGRDEALRKKSAEFISSLDFDGFGIGGSFAKEDMSTAVEWVNSVLPEGKPRHLLGIGEPEDLFMGVENGVDLFDCVAPTRLARNGTIYTKIGKIHIKNAQFERDFTPVESDCDCYTCKHYTKAYLAHLFRGKEMLGGTLATIHNMHFIVGLVARMRKEILEGDFQAFKKAFLLKYTA